ncbi:hypothetical protein LCGC14_0942050, partial [marine sediment metagenome]
MNNTVGVVVGRFQIDQLHEGHILLLDYVQETHPKMLILLGVRPAEASDTNPLDYESRAKMLREYYPKATILPVVDCRNDEVWSKRVDELIQTVYGHPTEAVFHVGRDSFAPHYTGTYSIETHEFGDSDELAACKIRNEVQNEVPETRDQRHGAIYAIMNLPHRFTMMVDMCLTRGDGKGSYEILVGKKPLEDKWRLPGGHVDRGESFRQAAS